MSDKMSEFKDVAFEVGEPNSAYAQYFTGESFLKVYEIEGGSLCNVSFSKGCRNNWHIHEGACQTLIVVKGEGIYQEWGKEPIYLKEGMVITIPPQVKHWHGAVKNNIMQHLSYMVNAANIKNIWCESVTDDEYQKAHQALGL